MYTKNEPMIELYIFETSQLIEQLEAAILNSEKDKSYNIDTVNDIFRIMHTIKGSSAMMLFDNITSLTHTLEDLFYLLREKKPVKVDYEKLTDIVLNTVDFIKVELEKIKESIKVDGNPENLISAINWALEEIKRSNGLEDENKRDKKRISQFYISQSKDSAITQKSYNYKAIITFEDGCEMENIRAYTIIRNLKEISNEYTYFPSDIIDNDDTAEIIKKDGFQIVFKTSKEYTEVHKLLMETIFLRELILTEVTDESIEDLSMMNYDVNLRSSSNHQPKVPEIIQQQQEEKKQTDTIKQQSIISVNVKKLDKLMDLVGEMVIAEAMVTQNPDLNGLQLENFSKSARQLKKITSEIQDMVMSIRMVPLSNSFHKMHRIVRDMCKKLDKEVELEIAGEETEVDKNIIEHISDPLMHLVRNAIDHGIESPEERQKKGKSRRGIISLEAKNVGSDVLIIVKDNGKGLNKNKILKRAQENGLLFKAEGDMTDKEIYNLIFLPGFSTKDNVTEFSGRGVGMDVVVKNIESVGGSVSVDSGVDLGTAITIKIPLTLAIIEGMNIRVGASTYTIPITSIVESFRAKERDLLQDPDGNEMIMVRGQCYPILRLHKRYSIPTEITEITEGIIIMVADGEETLCIFADELLGQQQVVVKTLPAYIKNMKRIKGLAGCTLLGDGSISLILDVVGLMD